MLCKMNICILKHKVKFNEKHRTVCTHMMLVVDKLRFGNECVFYSPCLNSVPKCSVLYFGMSRDMGSKVGG